MRKLITILFLFISIVCQSQIIDWNNFSEEKMSEVMFNEMNQYVKRTHNGDSLILSQVVQGQIMTDNYKFMEKYCQDTLIHNPKWAGKFVPDTIKAKIIKEMPPNSNFIKGHWDKEYKFFWHFSYIEILASVNYTGYDYPVSYQTLAKRLIIGWNASTRGHKEAMNANFQNKVIVGVTTYYNKRTRNVVVSFVYVG